jgi:hypothetical protein
VSVALTWPHRLCLLRVLCTMPLLQAFPFPSTLEEVTLHPLSQACVFIYSSRGKWSSPLSCEVFLPPPLLQSFPLLVAGRTPQLPPSPLCLGPACLFTVPGRIPLPHLWCSGHPTLFATFLYCSYCLLISFSFFPWMGSVCTGGYTDLAQVVCGSTVYRLAHLVVHVFPSCLGAGDWWPRGPPGFYVQHEVEMLCAGWRCGGVKVLPLLRSLACKVCLQRLSKISL